MQFSWTDMSLHSAYQSIESQKPNGETLECISCSEPQQVPLWAFKLPGIWLTQLNTKLIILILKQAMPSDVVERLRNH
jgi:hypothetical protein